METTETDKLLPRRSQRLPTLRILFSGRASIELGQQSQVLPMGESLLGRVVAQEAGISLPEDSRASRQHAALTVRPDCERVTLRDLGSKNGCFVNGAPTRGCELSDGDVLRIGGSVLLLRYETAERLDAPSERLIGDAPSFRRLRHRIAQIARQDAAVLVLGETGVGKDVTVQALHEQSGRRGRLVSLNCAAIPSELAESQLFGHTPGAFSGARTAAPGFFRAAQGGSLFLDEIGDLPYALQAKLLRAIEERAVIPVGSTTPIACDVRILSATNLDLEATIRAGRFRADLYARLSGLVLTVPALRERKEDILPLLAHFIGPQAPPMTPRLAEAMILHPWPYNVRELRQVAADLTSYAATEPVLDLDLIAARLNPPKPEPWTVRSDEPTALSSNGAATTGADDDEGPGIPRATLVRLLEENDGILSRVARSVGRSRRQVGRWLAFYKLSHRDFRG